MSTTPLLFLRRLSSNPAAKVRLLRLIREKPVVLFMKGSPEAPRCRWSRRAVELLENAAVSELVWVDVLKSPTAREEVKDITDHPTIPQLFVGGRFVGGVSALEALGTAELRALLAKHRASFVEKE